MTYAEIHIFDGEYKAGVRINGTWQEIEAKLVEQYQETIKALKQRQTQLFKTKAGGETSH